jgi:hypothetical protein
MGSVVSKIVGGLQDAAALAAVVKGLVDAVEKLFSGQRKKGKAKSKVVKAAVQSAGITVDPKELQGMIDNSVAAGFDQPASLPAKALPKNGLDPDTGRPIGLTSAHSGVK